MKKTRSRKSRDTVPLSSVSCHCAIEDRVPPDFLRRHRCFCTFCIENVGIRVHVCRSTAFYMADELVPDVLLAFLPLIL